MTDGTLPADAHDGSVRLSVVVPSYMRERVLVETLESVASQLRPSDELLVVDQTPEHESSSWEALDRLAREGRIRWIRKTIPGICEAMNVGALMAQGDVLLFLDDDIVPSPRLLEAHREVFASADAALSACGQVLQPWNEGPVPSVRDFAMGFDFAYSQAAEILPVAAGNFAVRRDVFLAAGGMDETFRGGAHRCDAEIGFRLARITGRRARFVPEASVRHLQSSGGTRAHGHKDTWAAIDSAVGDDYFGLRCLGAAGALRHAMGRLVRAPLNRRTVRRPWLILSLLAREIVAFFRALARARKTERPYIRPLGEYPDVEDSRTTLRAAAGIAGDRRVGATGH